MSMIAYLQTDTQADRQTVRRTDNSEIYARRTKLFCANDMSVVRIRICMFSNGLNRMMYSKRDCCPAPN